MAKWGGEGIRRAFSRESGRSSGRRVRCLRKTCHTRTLRTEREPRLLDSLVAAILLLADGEGESGVAEEEEKNGRFIVRFGRRAHPLFLRKFLGSRPSLRRPRRSRRRRSGIGDGGAAAEDITGRERRMNICKLQRATPSGGSRIGDQSQERRERRGGRNVLVIITLPVIAVGIDIRANTGDMHQSRRRRRRKRKRKKMREL